MGLRIAAKEGPQCLSKQPLLCKRSKQKHCMVHEREPDFVCSTRVDWSCNPLGRVHCSAGAGAALPACTISLSIMLACIPACWAFHAEGTAIAQPLRPQTYWARSCWAAAKAHSNRERTISLKVCCQHTRRKLLTTWYVIPTGYLRKARTRSVTSARSLLSLCSCSSCSLRSSIREARAALSASCNSGREVFRRSSSTFSLQESQVISHTAKNKPE